MAIVSSSGARLAADHVERFNAGVRSGDFSAMLETFSDRARLTFEGIPVGPFTGRPAIARAYREMPPDDEIRILSTTEPDASTVVVRYAWQRDGTTGTMTYAHDGGRITSLAVAFDPR